MGRFTTLLALAIVLIALIAALLSYEDGAVLGMNTDDFVRAAAFAAMALFVGGGLFGRGQLSTAVRSAVIWLGIALMLIAGYAYRHEAAAIGERIVGVLVPGMAISGRDGNAATVSVVRSADGHFSLSADVEGTLVDFLVDSGASTVVLTLRDARRAGYRAEDLRFSVPISTANGQTVAAPIRIGEIAVGDIRATNVRGLVARPGSLSQSLLGMTFLDRLSRWEVSGDRLVLTQ